MGGVCQLLIVVLCTRCVLCLVDLTNPATFRDLSKPIGALNGERLAFFKVQTLNYTHTVLVTQVFDCHHCVHVVVTNVEAQLYKHTAVYTF